MDLASPLTSLPGVGPKVATALERLGLTTVRELIWYPPFRYIDASKITPINSLRIGEMVVVKGTILSIKEKISLRRLKMLYVEVEDSSGAISVMWFNQPYIKNNLNIGTEIIINGKVAYDFKNKKLTLTSPLILNSLQIIPIYHETRGINSALIRRLIKSLLNGIKELEDPIPTEIIGHFNLPKRAWSLERIHSPQSLNDINLARRRLGFEELLFLGLQIRSISSQEKGKSSKIVTPIKQIKSFVEELPFTLTDSQRKAAWEILKDMDSFKPMQRLLMGDVGSGKTVVGAIASFATIYNNQQALWLAPTEVLANQHFQTLTKLFEGSSYLIGLYTAANKKADLVSNDIIVGTHALLEPNCKFGNIGLIIVDEQHRFGVKQRARLKELSNSPHFLSMTATPIPRTLALTIYGDLSISTLTQLPSNRLDIITEIIADNKRQSMYDLVAKEIMAGRQAFIITPLIEDKETNTLFPDKKSVLAEYERLKNIVFPNFKVDFLHGKLKSKEKSKIMDDFRDGKSDILISTSVIEVGIDIPNATIMIIENAESFGLAQLHQFRGRVGRGHNQSYCFLVTNNNSQNNQKRLQAMVQYNSGFKLAEIDLELRGPGSLVGLKQSGLPDLRLASLTDTVAIKDAQVATNLILEKGISPQLKSEIENLAITSHFE
jgi:ATP-dependent DNA helicase RecG